MIKITSLLIVCVALAWASEQHTNYISLSGGWYRKRNDLAFVALCLILSLFSGLRTDYNDTWNYMYGFRRAENIWEFCADPENFHLLSNPLFYFFQSLLKTITSEEQILILITSAFTQVCFMLFLKRYSRHFTFSIFLYICLGTFTVTMGAIKQTLAMAVLTLGFPCLEQRKLGRFYLLVFIAMLFHTYAASFALLPLFRRKPWSLFTFLFVGGVLFVLNNFHEVILEFMEQANAVGKRLEAYEVLAEYTVNLFRVAVYAVPPLFSLVFIYWVNRDSTPMDNILIHMSIISLAFMLMATQAGANMFTRMAHYFEIGTLCCLPNMIDKPFVPSSMKLVYSCAILGFLGFFAYASIGFDDAFTGLGLLGLF